LLLLLALALAGAALVVACTPKIGDKCQISTDCSVRGDRLCDISQPNGYCTQVNCQGGSCPLDESSCVLFESAVPGCTYDDRAGPLGSRVARSFCMANCTSNGDCRSGYVCGDPRSAPWNATILDNDQTKRTCLPIPLDEPDAAVPDGGLVDGEAPVCGVVGPLVTPIDAGAAQVHDASVDLSPIFPSPASSDAGH
jgi:hypothetical protein